jgi:hypothetical protein
LRSAAEGRTNAGWRPCHVRSYGWTVRNRSRGSAIESWPRWPGSPHCDQPSLGAVHAGHDDPRDLETIAALFPMFAHPALAARYDILHDFSLAHTLDPDRFAFIEASSTTGSPIGSTRGCSPIASAPTRGWRSTPATSRRSSSSARPSSGPISCTASARRSATRSRRRPSPPSPHASAPASAPSSDNSTSSVPASAPRSSSSASRRPSSGCSPATTSSPPSQPPSASPPTPPSAPRSRRPSASRRFRSAPAARDADDGRLPYSPDVTAPGPTRLSGKVAGHTSRYLPNDSQPTASS